MNGRALAAAGVIASLAGVATAAAQTGSNILLVSNALSQPSADIADYYAGRRAVPSGKVLRLPLPVAEEISRADYEQKIEGPIGLWLASHTAQDRIAYIVLTKDVPLRIAGTGGTAGTVASVDSERTLLYRKLAGRASNPAGSVRNPYVPDATASTRAARYGAAQAHREDQRHRLLLVGLERGRSTGGSPRCRRRRGRRERVRRGCHHRPRRQQAEGRDTGVPRGHSLGEGLEPEPRRHRWHGVERASSRSSQGTSRCSPNSVRSSRASSTASASAACRPGEVRRPHRVAPARFDRAWRAEPATSGPRALRRGAP